QKANRQEYIHEWPGEGDNQALPAWFGKQGAGVVDVVVGGLLSGHLDVSAKEDERKPVVRLASAKAKQPRTESKTERFHLHVEKAGSPKMPQLMDHDHDPDQDEQ